MVPSWLNIRQYEDLGDFDVSLICGGRKKHTHR